MTIYILLNLSNKFFLRFYQTFYQINIENKTLFEDLLSSNEYSNNICRFPTIVNITIFLDIFLILLNFTIIFLNGFQILLNF